MKCTRLPPVQEHLFLLCHGQGALVKGGHWHVHQLFHHLRGRKNREILGTAISGSVSSIHKGMLLRPERMPAQVHREQVGELLHSVPLNALLRPPRLCQAAGLVAQAEELRLGRRMRPGRRRAVHLSILRSCPGHLWSPWG